MNTFQIWFLGFYKLETVGNVRRIDNIRKLENWFLNK